MSEAASYALFGLHVSSEVELPEVPEWDSNGAPDVTVTLGTVAEDRSGKALDVFGDVLVLNVPDVGCYRIAHGREIRIEAATGAAPQNIRLFLLGSAFGLLLHQRGLLPLHANAIEVGGKAVAFMGKSGAGKSTLAGWFQDRGHRVLADDVCVVEFDEAGVAWVRPGVARLRLWREALQAAGREPDCYPQSFLGERAPDKFDVPLERVVPGRERRRLAALYLLESAEDPSIEPLTGAGAFEAASANTYRGQFIDRAGNLSGHWSAAVKLAQSIPMFRVRRRWGFDQIDAESQALKQHAEAIAAD